MASTYVAGSLGTFTDTGFVASPALSVAIPDNSVTGASHTLAVAAGTASVIEAVQIRVSATHTYNGDLAIELTSPTGTRSVLKNGRDGFGPDDNFANMVLLSNAFYGEPAVGSWTIKLVDTAAADTGTLTGWAIRIYGH
jgi:subtilisin-like proprotein convertase family protein